MIESPLLHFLKEKMSMTEVYQPVVIRELLLKGGTCSKSELALALARYDQSVIEFYEKVLMRWPKQTLVKHGIVAYDRKTKTFTLSQPHAETAHADVEIAECENQIRKWQRTRSIDDRGPESYVSQRYKVLSQAKGKCQLCGIPAYIRPLDIDHIVPQSKADTNKRVFKDGQWIYVHSVENLQALCFKCNRNKRDTDNTDFRRVSYLTRDRAGQESPDWHSKTKALSNRELEVALREIVLESLEQDQEGRVPYTLQTLSDALEAIIELAEIKGSTDEALLQHVHAKRSTLGNLSARIHRIDLQNQASCKNFSIQEDSISPSHRA